MRNLDTKKNQDYIAILCMMKANLSMGRPVKEMGDCIIRKRRRGGAGRVINKRRK